MKKLLSILLLIIFLLSTTLFSKPVYAMSIFEDESVVFEFGNDNAAIFSESLGFVTWGLNYGYSGFNKIAINTVDEYQNTPTDVIENLKLNDNETITKIELGESTSFVITSDHRLIGFGGNRNAQLGFISENFDYDTEPTDITNLFPLKDGEYIVDVTSKTTQTGVLTNLGNVYYFGLGINGILGNNVNLDQLFLPFLLNDYISLDEGEEIIKIMNSNKNSFLLTNYNRLFVWGGSYYGLLPSELMSNVLTPLDITSYLPMDEDEYITDFEVAVNSIFVITSKDRLFAWGKNPYGQLGNGSTIDIIVPELITSYKELLEEGEYITKVKPGPNHTFLVTNLGNVLAAGTNYIGQLGLENVDSSEIFIKLPDNFDLIEGDYIVDAFAGFDASAFITAKGEIFTVGGNTSYTLGDDYLPFDYVTTEPIKILFVEERTLSNKEPHELKLFDLYMLHQYISYGSSRRQPNYLAELENIYETALAELKATRNTDQKNQIVLNASKSMKSLQDYEKSMYDANIIVNLYPDYINDPENQIQTQVKKQINYFNEDILSYYTYNGTNFIFTDLNNDGITDIVSSYEGGLYLSPLAIDRESLDDYLYEFFRASKAIYFDYNISKIYAQDINNDTYQDLIVVLDEDGEHRIQLLINDKQNDFETVMLENLPALNSKYHDIKFFDINKDNKIDFSIILADGSVKDFLGNGDGTFNEGTIEQGVFESVDYLALRSNLFVKVLRTSNNVILKSIGEVNNLNNLTFSINSNTELFTYDFDNDGTKDFIFIEENMLYASLYKDAYNFEKKIKISNHEVIKVDVADINGDLKEEIVFITKEHQIFTISELNNEIYVGTIYDLDDDTEDFEIKFISLYGHDILDIVFIDKTYEYMQIYKARVEHFIPELSDFNGDDKSIVLEWFYDEDFSDKYDMDDRHRDNEITLYGKWRENINSITLVDYYWDFYDIIEGYAYNSSVELPQLFEEGFDFVGWYYNGQIYTDIFDAYITSDIILEPIFKYTLYPINYEGPEGMIHDNVLGLESYEMLELSDATLVGHDFIGWYFESDFSGDKVEYIYHEGIEIVLYARFEKLQFVISFDTNGGSAISDLELYFGDDIKLTNIPTKEGYVFNGWQGNLYTTMPAEDITLTATWLSYKNESKEAVVKGLENALDANDFGSTNLDIKVNVDLVELEKITTSEVNIINEYIKNTLKLNSFEKIFFDIAIKVENKDNNLITVVEQTKNLIEFTVNIPKENLGASLYRVIRIHKGEAEDLTTTYNEELGTLTFTSDKFSTYVIVYETNINAQGFFNNIFTIVLFVIIFILIIGLFIFFIIKKHKKEDNTPNDALVVGSNEDENDFIMIAGMKQRHEMSFKAKLSLSSKEIREKYAIIKKEIYKLEPALIKLSFKHETLFYKNKPVLRLRIRGKALHMYAKLPMAKLENFNAIDVSDIKTYYDTPLLVKITAKDNMDAANKLINELKKYYNMHTVDRTIDPLLEHPVLTVKKLIDMGLIRKKVLIDKYYLD